MSNELAYTKANLTMLIEREWAALNTALDRLTPAQLSIKDAQGWTVKDHVAHMAAWERSVVFMLQGKRRHEGLGVDEALYERDDVDAINAAVQQQHADLSFADARNQLRDVHRQMVALLEKLTDTDLQQRYRHYLPDEPGDGDGPMVIEVIYGNTAGHFEEHQGWIEGLVTNRS